MTEQAKRCSFDGCDGKMLARGLCGGHYRQKFQLKRELTKLTGKHLSAEKRFWARVQKTETCWLFNSSTVGIGHATISVFGERLAHRVSWIIHFGPIPKGDGFHGTCVRHKCDVPSCVNPEHLELGTHQDNMRDMMQRGRAPTKEAKRAIAIKWTQHRRGERWHAAKLSNQQSNSIKERRARGETTTALAKEFGVSQSLVSRITRSERRHHG